MKARVKGTTEIIEVEFDSDALNNCYPPYRDRENNMFYQPEQLEWIDIEEKAEPDYWVKLKHQYVGMAMQGLLNNSLLAGEFKKDPNNGIEDMSNTITNAAVVYATKLVEKLKEDII